MWGSSLIEDATSSSPRNNDFDISNRVILLLDLDCFYASCECVRLGLDASTTPLALLQWDSVLAVTYPARTKDMGEIKRGDSWEQVRAKSRGRCYGVHVPLLEARKTQQSSTDEAEMKHRQADETPDAHDVTVKASTLPLSIEQDFEQVFGLDTLRQERDRNQCLGRRRYASEGKASLEVYRLASARIFQVVREELCILSPSAVLERASIDEFYLDVSRDCWKKDDMCADGLLKETVIIGTTQPFQCSGDIDADACYTRALLRGCALARRLRNAVQKRLGFTVSAGISVNKTLAKLSSAHGKPNGQALTLPAAIPYMLEQSQIRKCPSLGGKLGKVLQSLLAPGVPATIASLQTLSLPALSDALGGRDTARRVYNLARGIETDPVEEKTLGSALTKSITSFKSLPNVGDGCRVSEASAWIELLSRDIVARVERDALRNKRYPRSCSIQYSNRQLGRRDKSIRRAFPPMRFSAKEKIEELVGIIPRLIEEKEGSAIRVTRLGICAIDFIEQGSNNNAIKCYFSSKGEKKESIRTDQRGNTSRIAKIATKKRALPREDDLDLKVAVRLQAKFDRENRSLEALEKKIRSTPVCKEAPPKTRRIDSFFQKRET